MKLYLIGHNFHYALEQIVTVLFPAQRPEVVQDPPPDSQDACISSLQVTGGTAHAEIQLRQSGQSSRASAQLPLPDDCDHLQRERILQRAIKTAFYHAALPFLDQPPPWGTLTGVRPAKLASLALSDGSSESETLALFQNDYFVSEPRAKLALQAAKAGLHAKNSLRPEEFSLYVGIPFCPTRCVYCSFVSADVKRTLRLVEPFLQALHREIDATATLVRAADAKVRTIYIGGGTPTTLSASQLDDLLSHLRRAFDLSHLTEFTVEAGRPDTITPEKMAVLHDHHVGRVSVNPQSMRDEVLRAMGRSHTAADILAAYQCVRTSGIPSVNMDLIAGLPKDSPDGFRYTLETVLALAPENITVHTLSLKKGARLKLEREGLPSAHDVETMLDYAWPRLQQAGYTPYYLYRQKYMTGALENVGWCLPRQQGLYNICIMEALHTILALGAGGATKLTDPSTGRIVRFANPKYPTEYIDRIDKICEEKYPIADFLRAVQRNTPNP